MVVPPYPLRRKSVRAASTSAARDRTTRGSSARGFSLAFLLMSILLYRRGEKIHPRDARREHGIQSERRDGGAHGGFGVRPRGGGHAVAAGLRGAGGPLLPRGRPGPGPHPRRIRPLAGLAE